MTPDDQEIKADGGDWVSIGGVIVARKGGTQ